MALRTAVLDGTTWNVWDVHPTASGPFRISLVTASGLTDGWLCFECEGEKRRLAPVPEGWEEWADERLAVALAAAAVVPPRPAGGLKRLLVPIPLPISE